MTRGRPSLQAIDEAAVIAAKRGVVIEIKPLKKSPFDLYVIRPNDNVAIKVKRIRSHIQEPQEISVTFRYEIAEIRSVQLPPMVQREFWTLTPWGTWQFFLILDDWIVEISSNGDPLPSSLQDPKNPAPPGSPPGILKEVPRDTVPRSGFLCPFYAQVRG
jgi:hypothetical protein